MSIFCPGIKKPQPKLGFNMFNAIGMTRSRVNYWYVSVSNPHTVATAGRLLLFAHEQIRTLHIGEHIKGGRI
jgi:hypothetical protein